MAKKTFEKWKKQWPEHLMIQLFKNTKFKDLGEWLYEQHSSYSGENHKEFCALVSEYTFTSLITLFYEV